MSNDHIEPLPRRYHHGDLANALLDAVEAAIVEDGLDAVTVRGCARRVGVAPSAAFRHYADKRDLMTAFAARGLAGLVARIEAEQAAAGPAPAARFRAVGEAYLAYALDHPGRFRAMFRSEHLRMDDPRLRAEDARLEAHLRDGLAAIVPPADGAEAARLKELLAWGVVHGLATLAADGQLDPLLPPDARRGALVAALGLMGPAFLTPAPRPPG